MLEAQALGKATPVSTMAAAAVESDLGRGDTEKMSISSHELPVNSEVEETVNVTHEEVVTVPISLKYQRDIGAQLLKCSKNILLNQGHVRISKSINKRTT